MSSISTAMPTGSSARPTAARVAPGIAEHFDQQVRAPIEDCGSLVKAWSNIHHPENLDDLLYPFKITKFGLEGGQDR